MNAELYIGLISGTSMDGIDAVLTRFEAGACRLVRSRHVPYPEALHADLRRCAEPGAQASVAGIGELDVRVAAIFADAAAKVIAQSDLTAADVVAIGSHGQTVLHQPDGPHPFSMQLGDPATLAVLTGITTVADFRNADLALGGQGAPLVPAFHAWLCRADARDQAFVNIGGIANVSLIAADGEVRGHDTGPGNTLLDDWCRRHRDQPFDRDGEWAAGGRVDPDLLDLMLADAYFTRAAPKSTGVDYFNGAWTDRHLARLQSMPAPRDVQATLAELTARTVAKELDGVISPQHIALCGGGAHNSDLVKRLQRLLPGRQIETTECWGIGPDWVEAAAFAWLARQRLLGIPSNVPGVTGARGAVSLGGVWLPANRG